MSKQLLRCAAIGVTPVLLGTATAGAVNVATAAPSHTAAAVRTANVGTSAAAQLSSSAAAAVQAVGAHAAAATKKDAAKKAAAARTAKARASALARTSRSRAYPVKKAAGAKRPVAIPATSCTMAKVGNLPGLKPWPNTVRKMIIAQFGIKNIGGYRPGRGSSDHHSGLALDVMVMKNKAAGDRVTAWAVANAKKLNVKYVIWYQRIWLPGQGWRAMGNRGSITANHKDHPHISFKAGTGRC